MMELQLEVVGTPKLFWHAFSAHALEPTRKSTGAAGYDLSSVEEVTVPFNGRMLIDTGIGIKLPPDTYGRIAPRSGLALNHFIDVGAGVIDADYRGSIKVLLFNFGAQDFKVLIGSRIAQLICERIFLPEWEHLAFDEWNQDEGIRGTNGWGSTGYR